jgi:hypothetical protein
MEAVESIFAHGHKNILATNEKTFEITRANYLSKRGDCIIAVAANKSLSSLNDEFKKILRNEWAKIDVIIQVGAMTEKVIAWGHPKLTLSSSSDMVFRRSSYLCDRTFAIKASKAAIDLSRDLVAKLKDPRNRVEIKLTVEDTTLTHLSR